VAKNGIIKRRKIAPSWDGNRYANSARVPAVTAPSGLGATPSGTTMALAWTNGEATATTVIERSLNGSTGWVEVATKNAGVTSHNDTALGNATYYYRVRHLINSVYSSYSSNANGTISGGSSGGSLAVGDTITITGPGFGTTSSTVFAQDFETGTPGAYLNTLGFSVARQNGPDYPTVTDSDSYTGTKCGKSNNDIAGNSAAYIGGLDVVECYISLHVKPVQATGAPHTLKGVRAHATADPGGVSPESIYTAYPGFMAQEPIGYGSTGHRLQINFGQQAGTSWQAVDSAPSNIADNAWTRQQYHYRLSTAGVADGFLRYWQGLGVGTGQTSVRNNFVTRASGITDTIATIMMPFYWGNGGTGSWYYDNVVIHYGSANTACRVEIGDSPAYANATKRECLVRESWSDASVSARLMPHTFGTGTAYVYVIGNDGSVLATQEVTLS